MASHLLKSDDAVWARLRNDLIEQIESGRLQAGARLSSVRELSERYAMGPRSTLKALKSLEAEGWLMSRPRSGYFVSPPSRRDSSVPIPVTFVSLRECGDQALAGEFQESFLSPLVHELVSAAEKQGMDLTFRTFSHPDSVANFESSIEQARALIASDRRVLEKILETVRRLPPAIVHIAGPIGADSHWSRVDGVTHNHEQGFYRAANRLITLGHRRIGLLTFRNTFSYARRNGLRLAALVHGAETLVVDREYRMRDQQIELGADMAREAVDRPDRPTALLCFNDYVAYGAMKHFAETGIRVPEDISLIGCDDMPFSRHTAPPLTSIRPPYESMARETLRLLLERLDGSDRRSIMSVLPCDLIERESCGPPPKRA